MTGNTTFMKHRHATFAQGLDDKPATLPVRPLPAPAAVSDEPSRSFIAVLLRCLSAPNA